MDNNKFCKKSVLRNESDVEHFFVIRLLKDLGYKDQHIYTKHSIKEHVIGKGNNRKRHVPDYLMRIGRIPVLIVEAKHPNSSLDQNKLREAQEYGMAENRNYIGKNPIQYAVVSNGLNTKLVKVDENDVVLDIRFTDFVDGNKSYQKLKDYISLNVIKAIQDTANVSSFEFRTPEFNELKSVFKQAHDLIRNKQKVGPKKAFYEFTKLLFVKLNEDEKIRKKEPNTIDDFNFSTNKINQTNEGWINGLFIQYRRELEGLVRTQKKKENFSRR